MKKTWKFKSHHTEEAKNKIGLSNKKAFSDPNIRKKISESKKGKSTSINTEFKKGHEGYKFWLGKKMSQETRRKISKANKGKKISPESIEKTASKLRGRKRPPFSEKWRANLSKGNLGKTMSPETRKKISDALKGDKSYRWKGGITKIAEKIRKSLPYELWRTAVFKRDKFTCQICNQYGRAINADHIKPFSLILKENNITSLEEALLCDSLWNVSNGRTLCVECHKQTPTYLIGARYL